MEIEDEDAALVDSFFLPGGLLDPEHYEDDSGVVKTMPEFVVSPPLPIQMTSLPSNPWASDSKQQAAKSTLIRAPLAGIAPPARPMHVSAAALIENVGFCEPAVTINSDFIESVMRARVASDSEAAEFFTFRPPPGFEVKPDPPSNRIAPIGPRMDVPRHERITAAAESSPDDEEDISQYSIPKELQENNSMASSASSLSTSTWGKKDDPSTVTAQTEKESIDPETTDSPENEINCYSKAAKPGRPSSIPVIEDRSPTERSPKTSQTKRNRRSRPHKRPPHKATTPNKEDLLCEEDTPTIRAVLEEPIAIDEPESESATKSLEAIFSGVTVVFWLIGTLIRGVLFLIGSLYNSTALARAILANLSIGLARTGGRYIAMCLSIVILLYGEAIMMIMEEFPVVICYMFLYLSPFHLKIISDFICAPHWIPQILGTVGMWYECIPLEIHMEKKCPLETSNSLNDIKTESKNPETTPKTEMTPLQAQQMKLILSIMTRYLLIGLVWWDGFSTEYGVLLGLSTSGRLLVAYTFSILRRGLSSVLLVSWAVQFLVACWCPQSLLMDQLLLVLGLSSIRMNQHLQNIKR